jgi:hypothetical protein
VIHRDHDSEESADFWQLVDSTAASPFSAGGCTLRPGRLTFRAERLRPASQLLQNKLTDRRAEVRSSDELGGGRGAMERLEEIFVTPPGHK